MLLFFCLFFFPVPLPAISISVPDGTLYVGSSVTATCFVMPLSEVDIDVVVVVTCFNGGENLLKNDSGIISMSEQSQTTSFMTLFELDPLGVAESNLTCMAKISPVAQMPFILESQFQSSTLISNITSKFKKAFFLHSSNKSQYFSCPQFRSHLKCHYYN